MARSRKRLIIVGCIVTVVILAGTIVLLFGLGQSQSGTTGGNAPQISKEHLQNETNKKLVADAATKLAVDLTSGDQAAYKAVWSHTNVPPLPPPGTTITVDTNSAQYSEAYSQVNAEVAMPGKMTVKSIIHLEPAGNEWRVRKIEEVK